LKKGQATRRSGGGEQRVQVQRYIVTQVTKTREREHEGVDNLDVLMEDRLADVMSWQPYENLSRYEDEDSAPVVAPQTNRKQLYQVQQKRRN